MTVEKTVLDTTDLYLILTLKHRMVNVSQGGSSISASADIILSDVIGPVTFLTAPRMMIGNA